MKRYIFVYKITNTINGKFYIGKHSTLKIDDGYFGSGVLIKKAVNKYGKENFKFEILKFFDSEKEAYEYERSIVNETEVKDKNCYNLMRGGKGLTREEALIKDTAANLIKYQKSEEGRRKSRERMKLLMQRKDMKEKARNNLKAINSNKNFIEIRNKRIKEVLIPYAKSDTAKELSRIRIRKYLESEEGRKHCINHGRELMTKFNASEKHHEVVVKSNKNRVLSKETKKLHSKNTLEFNKLYPERAKEKQRLAMLSRYFNIVRLIENRIVSKMSFNSARLLCKQDPRSLPKWESLIKRFSSVEAFVNEINIVFNERFSYEN